MERFHTSPARRAIVWLVHRRKFAALAAGGSQSVLARLSTSLPLLLFTLFVVGGGALVFNLTSRVTGTIPAQVLYSGGLLSIALVHFYFEATRGCTRIQAQDGTTGR